MPRFNPELVTMVPPDAEEGEEQVAVITVENLEVFITSRDWRNQGFISPLLNGIRWAGVSSRRIAALRVEPSTRGGHTSGYTSEQREQYTYDDGDTFGLRADQALRLLDDLQKGELRIRGIGQTRIERYAELCSQLYLEEAVPEDSAE